ncbi:hypothetical protein COK90_11545 [Priestia megaterium]|uniref:hypothetical protein n=1 Tax=Priestia megaterium TaxID=1404 RepID=UPI000BF4B093|nr:hypothetical protein [Priestia megaterium]PFU61797.1 hypothetical protein COK90_11545 [Priestia megaterium]
MTRLTEKGKRFEDLINRADKALENNYCIEASTIYYAILEERFYSIFPKIDINIPNGEKMFHCIRRLKKISQEGHQIRINNSEYKEIGSLISSIFDDSLLNGIDSWRAKRNDIIHDFAKQDIPYSDIEVWADEGKHYLRDFNACVMRFKKSLEKLKINN